MILVHEDQVVPLEGVHGYGLLTHLVPQLVTRVRQMHPQDRREGAGRVQWPGALARKYPNADREWGWPWVFRAPTRNFDRQAKRQRRHQLHESAVPKAMKQALQRAGVAKPATPPTRRHALATPWLEDGSDIRPMQERLGHQDLSTAMI